MRLLLLPLRGRPLRVARLAAFGFLVFLVTGNLAILALHVVARERVGVERVDGVDGVNKVRRVDEHLWAGAHPSSKGYAQLAAKGVSTVVDLRAEDDAAENDDYVESLGIDVVHLPTRDGQIPGQDSIDAFLEVVDKADGTVFVHCGAGVGRTGTMTSAYMVATGQASPRHSLGVSLAVGPPTLEQVAYIRSGQRPSDPIVALSRVLDAPRRLWSRFGL